MVEFTLTAIPLIFVLISMFEVCRGMWNYFTLADMVKNAARVAAVRGVGCAGKACAKTVGDMARSIASNGLGLPSGDVNLTFTSATGSIPCNPLSSCFANATAWPPAGGNGVGQEIVVSASYPFTSALSMFVPGRGTARFSPITLAAQSRQVVVF